MPFVDDTQWIERMTAARASRQERMNVRIVWFDRRLQQGLALTMQKRVLIAAQLLRDQIVINLSKPVRKYKRTRTRDTRMFKVEGGLVVSHQFLTKEEQQSHKKASGGKRGSTYTAVDPASRSKPGEFPRADTTRLMKDIFYRRTGPTSALVGTSLKYGVKLELKMNRSFLRRTLYEFAPTIRRILTQGVTGVTGFGVNG